MGDYAGEGSRAKAKTNLHSVEGDFCVGGRGVLGRREAAFWRGMRLQGELPFDQ